MDGLEGECNGPILAVIAQTELSAWIGRWSWDRKDHDEAFPEAWAPFPGFGEWSARQVALESDAFHSAGRIRSADGGRMVVVPLCDMGEYLLLCRTGRPR